MNADEVVNILEKNEFEARRLLESVGDDPLKRNAVMNNTYHALSQQDPTFIWLAGAALGSAKVGQNLQAASMGDLSFMDETNLGAIYKNLPGGNQDIFTNLVARYLTHREVGIEGVNQIRDSDKARNFGPPDIFQAFEQHDEGRKVLEKTAEKMGLSKHDQRVLEAHFSNPKNKELALNTAIKLMEHEQDVVQKMYVNELKKAMTDPMSIKAGELLMLTGVEIDGEFYSFPKYVGDPSNVSQRIEYFKLILTAIGEIYTDHAKLNKYLSDVSMAAEYSLWLVNPFIKGFNHIGGEDHIERALEYHETLLNQVTKFADAHSFPGENHRGFNALVQKEILYQSLLESDLYYPEMESKEFIDALFKNSDSSMTPFKIASGFSNDIDPYPVIQTPIGTDSDLTQKAYSSIVNSAVYQESLKLVEQVDQKQPGFSFDSGIIDELVTPKYIPLDSQSIINETDNPFAFDALAEPVVNIPAVADPVPAVGFDIKMLEELNAMALIHHAQRIEYFVPPPPPIEHFNHFVPPAVDPHFNNFQPPNFNFWW